MRLDRRPPNPAAVTGMGRPRSRSWVKHATPYVLLAPALILVGGVLGYGMVSGFATSLFRVEVWHVERPFVGLANYARLVRDPTFQNALSRSLVLVFATIAAGMVVSFSTALAVNALRRGRDLLLGLFLIPFLVSGVAAAVTWRFLFIGATGLITMALERIGITGTWLGDPTRALIVVTLANVWFLSPLSAVILFAGLQSIDPEIYEAAVIDGARRHQTLLYVTLPLIAPVVATSLVWLTFASFNMFDIVLPLTGGGPGRATEVLGVYMYRLAFRDLNYSVASAVMVILLMINVTFSAFYLRVFRV